MFKDIFQISAKWPSPQKCIPSLYLSLWLGIKYLNYTYTYQIDT